MSENSPAEPVSAAEIAALLAQARDLTRAGHTADPTARAAYLASKATLLARIAETHTHAHPCHAETARHIAADARHVAAQAAALAPSPDKDTP